MSFLPAEQGEHFKINLYDHGCGVAVADYDGDGDDDVYFLNQLGPNAPVPQRRQGPLHRRDGDGREPRARRPHLRRRLVRRRGRRRLPRPLRHDDARGQRLLPQPGRRHVRGRDDAAPGSRSSGTPSSRRSSTPTATATSTSCSRTPRAGPLDQLRRPGEVLRRARRPSSTCSTAIPETNRFYPQPRQRHVRRRDGGGGPRGRSAGAATPRSSTTTRTATSTSSSRTCSGADSSSRTTARAPSPTSPADTLGRSSWGTVGAKAFDYDGDGRLDLFLVDMHSDMWMDFSDFRWRRSRSRSASARRSGRLLRRNSGPATGAKAFFDRRPYDPKDVVFGNSLFRNLGGRPLRGGLRSRGRRDALAVGHRGGRLRRRRLRGRLPPARDGLPVFVPSVAAAHERRRRAAFADRAKEAGVATRAAARPATGRSAGASPRGARAAPRSPTSTATAASTSSSTTSTTCVAPHEPVRADELGRAPARGHREQSRRDRRGRQADRRATARWSGRSTPRAGISRSRRARSTSGWARRRRSTGSRSAGRAASCSRSTGSISTA